MNNYEVYCVKCFIDTLFRLVLTVALGVGTIIILIYI